MGTRPSLEGDEKGKREEDHAERDDGDKRVLNL